jgi:hypothetical protein
MRWLMVVAALAACGKGKNKEKPAPPSASSDAAAPVPSVVADAPPPPPDAAPAAQPATGELTGTYEIQIALPAKYTCEDPTAVLEPKQTFTIAIDSDGDGLVAEYPALDQPTVHQEPEDKTGLTVRGLVLRKSNPNVDLILVLKVDGTQVTGTAQLDEDNPNDPTGCELFRNAKVTGTRR